MPHITQSELTAYLVENQERFYRLAYSYLHDREEALDAVQTAVCKALEKQDGLKNADAIVREELDAYNARLFEQTGERNSEHSCWQYFCVLPDIKSVGVRDNKRADEWCVIIRAVNTVDAMTATVENVPFDLLRHITQRITDEVKGVNRVLFDLTPKPTGTIEFE